MRIEQITLAEQYIPPPIDRLTIRPHTARYVPGSPRISDSYLAGNATINNSAALGLIRSRTSPRGCESKETSKQELAMAENLNSRQSTPDSYDEDPVVKSELWGSPDSPPELPHKEGGKESGSAQSSKTAPVSMQKRRRVTRACDECRRKKIKCDGKQPCTHCTVYSYGESPIQSVQSRGSRC